jgi:hypothetical protein
MARSTSVKPAAAIYHQCSSGSRVEVLLVVPIRLQAQARKHDHADRLIEGDPVLDPVPKLFETESHVVLKVGQDVPRSPSSVTFLETGRKVPMEEGDEGSDTVGQESVDELVVIGDPRRVDGIVLAA